MTGEVVHMRPHDPADTAAVLRMPPCNYEAERALLGAILMNNRAYERVADFLLPEHFAEPVNARVFEALSSTINRGAPANPVTLKNALPADIVPDGGAGKYIAALAAGAVTIVNAGEYGRLIYDLYLRRELIAIGTDMVNEAFDADLDSPATAHIEQTEERLFALTAHEAGGAMADIGAAADAAILMAEAAHRRGGKLVGVTTGVRDLDAKLGGLHPSDLLILAGRPSMGKTGLATTIAVNAAKYFANPDKQEDAGKRVVFFSLEMSREQLATRILAHLGNLDSHAIRAGYLRQDQFEGLMAAREHLVRMPLHIDDSAASTVAAIRTRCRRLARKGGLGLIVIDYLQLIAPPGRERAENRVQEVSAVTRGLKALAKDLGVPILALSQLSRAVEQREDKRPQLSDLRESGTIEQDADAVIFVFREQYYLERAEPVQKAEETSGRFHERYAAWQDRCGAALNVAEAIISKQRHGPIGTVKMHFCATSTWFSDLDGHDDAAGRGRDKPRGGETVSHGTSGPPPGHPAAEQIPMEGF